MSERTLTFDRRSYAVIAAAFVLIVFAGFARTYYLKGVFAGPALSGLVHLHGFVMSAWVVLFATQVGLVAKRRVDLHRKLGVAAAIVAGLVLIVGSITAITAAGKGVSPGPPPLVFLVVPLGDLVVFGALVGVALAKRRRPDVHRRLMLLTCVALLPPAVGRLPIGDIPSSGPLVFFGLTDLFLLACVAYDTFRLRRLHPAFLWGGLFILVMQPLRMLIAATPAWMRFASWLTGA